MAQRILRRLRMAPVSILYFRGPVWMSAVRKRWLLFRNPHVTIRFGDGCYLGPGFSLHAPFGGTFIAGDRVEFRRDFRAELGGPGALISFGSGTIATYSVLIQCTTRVEIGERCVLARSVTIVDGNHRYRLLDEPMLDQGYDFRPIRIADDAAVMSATTVIADIGTRAFVGANAVVTRPVPPYTLAGGVPARVIDTFGPET